MEIHFTGGHGNWAACHVELYGSDMGGSRTMQKARGGVLQIAHVCAINSLCLDVPAFDSLVCIL